MWGWVVGLVFVFSARGCWWPRRLGSTSRHGITPIHIHSTPNTVEHVVISHDRNGIAYVTFKENASAVAVRFEFLIYSCTYVHMLIYIKFHPTDRHPIAPTHAPP